MKKLILILLSIAMGLLLGRFYALVPRKLLVEYILAAYLSVRFFNHGHAPQSKLWEQFPQQAVGYYPQLRWIVQLTNSAALRFRNWSFSNNDESNLITVKK